MTQRLYYFLDLFTPAWEWIKLHTFRGQMKMFRITDYLKRRDYLGKSRLERIFLYESLYNDYPEYKNEYSLLIDGLKKITSKGISLNYEKIIEGEIKRQRCDSFAHMYWLLTGELNKITQDDVNYLVCCMELGAFGIAEDIK